MKKVTLLGIIALSLFVLGCGVGGSYSGSPGENTGGTGSGGSSGGVLPAGPPGSVVVRLPGTGPQTLNPIRPIDNQIRANMDLTEIWKNLGSNGHARVVLRNVSYDENGIPSDLVPKQIKDAGPGATVTFNNVPSVSGYTIEVILSDNSSITDRHILKYGISNPFQVKPGETTTLSTIITAPIWNYITVASPAVVLTSMGTQINHIKASINPIYPISSQFHFAHSAVDVTTLRDSIFNPGPSDPLVNYSILDIVVSDYGTTASNGPNAPYYTIYFQGRFYIDNVFLMNGENPLNYYVNVPDPSYNDCVATLIAPNGTITVPIESAYRLK